MKATEIRLNRCTAARPNPAVITSPTTVVSRMAPISLAERTPSHSITSMALIITTGISQARCFSEANCSSSSGTEPVSRTRTPWAASSFRPAAVWRISALEAAPGSSAP